MNPTIAIIAQISLDAWMALFKSGRKSKVLVSHNDPATRTLYAGNRSIRFSDYPSKEPADLEIIVRSGDTMKDKQGEVMRAVGQILGDEIAAAA